MIVTFYTREVRIIDGYSISFTALATQYSFSALSTDRIVHVIGTFSFVTIFVKTCGTAGAMFWIIAIIIKLEF